MSLESYGAVARFLRAKGFREVRAQGSGTKAFRGELTCRGHAVRMRLEISDWDFVSYPRVVLEFVPDALKGFRPHVMSDGGLCYYAKGAIVLNRFKPAEAIARCLVRAQETLEDLADGREFRFGAADEFDYYWNQGWVYTGRIDPKKKRARLVYVEGNGREFYILSQGGDEAQWLARAVGARVVHQAEVPVWLIETQQHPSVDAAQGLPKTIKDTLDWVKRWDEISFQRLISALETKDYLEYDTVAFVFASPVGLFGFFLELDKTHRESYKRKPARYRQYLYSKGARTPVRRLYGVDVSAEFVHSRNIEGTSLIGKKVAVVGCGAIGGYAAHALIRLGAGVGHGGRLSLVDPESIEPGNLGRHILGFAALGMGKADALKNELSAQFPYAQLRMLKQDVRSWHGLFDEDLVVDATGEESLSIAMAGTHQQRTHGHGASPLLHVWVAGNGEAVQALLVDGKKGGCYRCMWVDDPDKGMVDRIPLLKKRPATRFVGCQSVTLFPVSAAMSAAALASDMIIDWVAGNPSPRFRTRTRENADTFRVKNQDLAKRERCPACSRT
jgi:molybdopterin/thiamine biosynthesis adenylyltransferase